MPLTWRGEGLEEVGVYGDRVLVSIDPRYFRPTEVESLLGDATKAKELLGWSPQVGIDGLIDDMLHDELKNYGLSL